MRFFHKISTGLLFLAGFSLLPATNAHDGGERGPSCLTKYIELAETLVGKITPDLFDMEAVRKRFTLPTDVRASDQNLPIIFYSDSPLNRRPIVTMARGRLSAAEALAIYKGKVIAVGSLSKVSRKAGGRRFYRNLNSQVVLPGFVEPHLHIVLSALLKGYFLDVSPLRAPTFDIAMSKLRAELATLQPGQWLLAYGYDPSRLDWHDLSSADLDSKVSSTVPIVVINASGHLAYVNSLAFKLANITKDTPNPPGGQFAKDPKTGDLTGVLVETGAIQQFSAIATKANLGRAGKIKDGLSAILTQWLSKGITTAFDGGLGAVTPQDMETVANLTEVSPIRIRAAVANQLPGAAESMIGKGRMPRGGYKSKGLVIKTVKLWSDGSTQGFTAAVKQNYLLTHFPNYFGNQKQGVLIWPDQAPAGESLFNTTMRDEMIKWLNRGYQIMVHSNGDRASSIVLNNFESIFKQYPRLHPRNSGILHRMEHFTVTEPSQVLKAKQLGIAVSHTMGHVHYWGDVFRTGVLGSKRAERIDPIRDDKRYGVVYSFNSDSPVTDADPLLWVETAITRKVYKTQNVLGEEQRVGLEDALNGVTGFPAKQILWEDGVGTLEEGKMADLVILSKDVRRLEWGRGKVEVVETWVGGVRQYLKSN